jgi:hypothetical protein
MEASMVSNDLVGLLCPRAKINNNKTYHVDVVFTVEISFGHNDALG